MLTPFQPEPMASPQAMATVEELEFDRMKKLIDNEQTLHEFLKLLNHFARGLMDKTALHDEVRNLFGGDMELLQWFERFIQWGDDSEDIQHTSQLMDKVPLSVCRGKGPSYRLLPKIG
jgi:paired amphipathic helix protein Sin3a